MELLDQSAREAFIHQLDENFCVGAGAGVGKTSAIVERIIQLAIHAQETQSDALSRLVVVTYGKLAAEELRIRSRTQLLNRYKRSAHERQQILTELHGAFFGTIHSFCLRLIANYGQSLDLPETIQLLEKKDEEVLWGRFCESEALQNLSFHRVPPFAHVRRHVTFAKLLELAKVLDHSAIDTLLGQVVTGEPPLPNLQLALEDDGGKNPKAKETTKRHQALLKRWIDKVTSPSTEPFHYLRIPEFKGGATSFLNAVEAGLRPYVQWLNTASGHVAAMIAQEWQRYRLERGLLNYRDMVFCARKLLEQPEILKQLRERKFIIILDEAQDTDAEMFSLLSELTRPVDAEVGQWPFAPTAAGPRAGHFSFVGDEQQAIYGSRADTAIYQQYVEAYKHQQGGRYLEFSVTMRCPENVIRTVNSIFVEEDRLVQSNVRFRQLNPRPNAALGIVQQLILNPLSAAEGKPKKDALLQFECEQIAGWIATQGKVGLGITHWNEFAILAPRVDWLEIAAKALQARGLPIHIFSQKKIARDLAPFSWPAALFHVLVNPWDTFELIGVLREIFAISDVWLARFQQTVPRGLNFWPKVEAIPELFHTSEQGARLVTALNLLHQLRSQLPSEATSENSTLSEYVHWVLEKIALHDRLRWIGQPNDGLEWFQEKAKQAQCNGVPLRQWVQMQVDALELSPPVFTGSTDTIALLTCHKSKGLEWPVVLTLGVSCSMHDPIAYYPKVVHDRLKKTTAIHFNKITVDPEITKLKTQQQNEEYQRLFYVAATRAKQRLIIADGSTLYEGTSGGGVNFLQLARWSELNFDRSVVQKIALSDTELDKTAQLESSTIIPFVPAYASPTKHEIEQAAEISRNILQRILPSQLGHALDENYTTTTGVGGTDYGNWWHQFLESYPWKSTATKDWVESKLQTLTGPMLERARKEVDQFLSSTLYQELLSEGKTFLTEATFAYPYQSDVWIEGVIDFVVIDKTDHIWIIDWKTDRPKTNESEAQFAQRLLQKYSAQLQAYAHLFKQTLQRPLKCCFLYSTFLGKRIDIPNFDTPLVLEHRVIPIAA